MMRLLFLSAALMLMTAAGTAFGQNVPSPDDQYVLGPDSGVQPGVPEGKVTEFVLKDSKVYPGFEHKWWLYVPAAYDGRKRIALMFFMDGEMYVARDGMWRVPTVLNNLIEKREIPVMAAVFINPGVSYPKAPDGSPMGSKSNRLLEYSMIRPRPELGDSARGPEVTPFEMTDAYSRFLLNEIMPEVRKKVKITDDPEGRATAGYSSGGICAFTLAWQRPDQFRRVFSNNGAFQGTRPEYAEMVRHSEKKPIRFWHQAGENDVVDPEWGSLLEYNQHLAAAFEEKGYDSKFVIGKGTHSPQHAASVFPDAMRWLWRDYPK